MSGKEFGIVTTKCDFCGLEKATVPLEQDSSKRMCMDCYRAWERYINMVPRKVPAM